MVEYYAQRAAAGLIVSESNHKAIAFETDSLGISKRAAWKARKNAEVRVISGSRCGRS
jgi:hypothetical protein